MTAQSPDTIIYKGEEYYLFSEPLQSYLAGLEHKFEFIAISSAFWRGYQSNWEIDNNILYLEYFLGNTKEGTIHLDELFPSNKGRVKASWYSGKIFLSKGEQIFYVHMGYESTYQYEITFDIKEGEIVKETLIDNSPLLEAKKKVIYAVIAMIS